jgi:hypothetical protein
MDILDFCGFTEKAAACAYIGALIAQLMAINQLLCHSSLRRPTTVYDTEKIIKDRAGVPWAHGGYSARNEEIYILGVVAVNNQPASRTEYCSFVCVYNLLYFLENVLIHKTNFVSIKYVVYYQ